MTRLKSPIKLIEKIKALRATGMRCYRIAMKLRCSPQTCYYHTGNKEKHLANGRKWRAKNRDRDCERQRKYLKGRRHKCLDCNNLCGHTSKRCWTCSLKMTRLKSPIKLIEKIKALRATGMRCYRIAMKLRCSPQTCYYHTGNKEKHIANVRKWRAKNRDRDCERQRKYLKGRRHKCLDCNNLCGHTSKRCWTCSLKWRQLNAR